MRSSPGTAARGSSSRATRIPGSASARCAGASSWPGAPGSSRLTSSTRGRSPSFGAACGGIAYDDADADAATATDAVRRGEARRDQAPLLRDDAPDDSAGLGEGARSAQVDDQRRRAAAGGRLHGRARTDASRMGARPEKGKKEEAKRQEKEPFVSSGTMFASAQQHRGNSLR